MMLRNRARPRSVPRVIASIVLFASECVRPMRRVSVAPPVSGTITQANMMAAGALMIEAVSRWPTRIVVYSTSTVPAIVAMPQAMTMNSSARLSCSR